MLGLLGAGCSKRPSGVPDTSVPGAKPAKRDQEKTKGGASGSQARRDEDSPTAGTTGAGGARRPLPGYDRRVEDLAGVDASVLRGRKIVLDPGHGGRFPGSLGPKGLSEAEVNLGVALHLWGLLTDAGAEVLLTRASDRDFTTREDSSLKADLTARADKANAFDADVFLSLHHNADAGGRNDQNEIQTYYKFSDPDASYDLADAIHTHLKRNLGIEADRIIPGNFFVLRNSNAPAVLGESSYLTNPDVEQRLALSAKQRLEAEAYFLGLVTYFRRGVPRLLATRVEPTMGGADPRDGSERPFVIARTDRAPGTVRLVIDGVPIDTTAIVGTLREPGMWEVRYRPPVAFTDGRHVATWAVRALGGNWSKAVSDTFEADLPIAKVELEVSPANGAAAGQIVGLTLRALDRHGRTVSDTLSARFSTRVGAVVVDSLAPRTLSPGEARAYARLTGGGTAAFIAHVRRPSVRLDMVDVELTLTIAQSSRAWTGFTRGEDGTPVPDARVGPAGAPDSLSARTNADGFYALARAPGDSALSAIAPGFVSASGSGATRSAGTLAMLPVLQGVLHGKRIAIDPMGGGVDTSFTGSAASRSAHDVTPGATANGQGSLASVGPGTAAADSVAPEFLSPDSQAVRRASVLEADANLRVARALEEYLEAAGATVVLTRDRPESLTAVERLRRTEALVPDRVVVIAHRQASGATIGHYFSSAGGKALAKRIEDALEDRDVVGKAEVAETGNYVVAQTGAIAVALNGPSVAPLYAEPGRGERRLREEAYAIYLALAEDFGAERNRSVSLAAKVTRAGAPAADVPVLLDGRWTLVSDPHGKVRFWGVPAGATVALSVGDSTAPGRVRITTPVSGEITLDAGPTGQSP